MVSSLRYTQRSAPSHPRRIAYDYKKISVSIRVFSLKGVNISTPDGNFKFFLPSLPVVRILEYLRYYRLPLNRPSSTTDVLLYGPLSGPTYWTNVFVHFTVTKIFCDGVNSLLMKGMGRGQLRHSGLEGGFWGPKRCKRTKIHRRN